MIKEDYNKVSDKLGLPRRCPLIGKCERYLHTVYELHYDYEIEQERLVKSLNISHEQAIIEVLIKEDKLYEKDKNEIIKSYGNKVEVVKWGKEAFTGSNKYDGRRHDADKGWSFSYINICPEVTLYENFDRRLNVPNEALNFVSYYLNIRENEEIERKNSCHFSECAEFSKFQFENLNKSVKNKSIVGRRPAISKTLRFEIFQRDKNTCQYCGRTVEDGVKLVVDHKVSFKEGGKTDFSNLVTSCEECNQGKSDKIV